MAFSYCWIYWYICIPFFSCDQAALRTLLSVSPSICPFCHHCESQGSMTCISNHILHDTVCTIAYPCPRYLSAVNYSNNQTYGLFHNKDLTSMMISFIKIRCSHDYLIFIMGISIHGKIYWKQTPGSSQWPQTHPCLCPQCPPLPPLCCCSSPSEGHPSHKELWTVYRPVANLPCPRKGIWKPFCWLLSRGHHQLALQPGWIAEGSIVPSQCYRAVNWPFFY